MYKFSKNMPPEMFEFFSVMLQLYMNMISPFKSRLYNSSEPPEVGKPLVILEPISETVFCHILKPTVQLIH